MNNAVEESCPVLFAKDVKSLEGGTFLKGVESQYSCYRPASAVNIAGDDASRNPAFSSVVKTYLVPVVAKTDNRKPCTVCHASNYAKVGSRASADVCGTHIDHCFGIKGMVSCWPILSSVLLRLLRAIRLSTVVLYLGYQIQCITGLTVYTTGA